MHARESYRAVMEKLDESWNITSSTKKIIKDALDLFYDIIRAVNSENLALKREMVKMKQDMENIVEDHTENQAETAPKNLNHLLEGPHLRHDCPHYIVGEQPCCLNCRSAGLEKTDHGAFSVECPVRRKWDSIARLSVTYC
ncbi:unnamed protein product [Leptidea sinapis]|uniref:Uncharacterized protein n=1 Tax=Leptidea sinapis TaxID=189913 RepID=A0A5E4PQQ9_9NEOP|nr:unnamed protein product [Leptidea sinapis]